MKDRIFIVLLSSWLAPLESLKIPSVQQPQERGTMLVDAKVFSLIQTNLHGRPDALASSTAARKSKNREDGGLATLKGYKTNLRGGIDVNPQIEDRGTYVSGQQLNRSYGSNSGIV